MTQITRQEAMRRLMCGMADDVTAYGNLQALLAEQFDAALRHQSKRLSDLAYRITHLCDTLELRRQHRAALVNRLLGPATPMNQIFALLKGNSRANLEANWQSLEQLLVECKRLGKRNNDLLVEQYSIMQRVLHGEEQIYAPA